MMKIPPTMHFVLFHGAWCWYKIKCLLESAVNKVTSLDLRSSGIDPSDPNTIYKFEEYNFPLDEVLSTLEEGEKVILVGHSAGGLDLTAAIHNYTEKIEETPDSTIDEEICDYVYGRTSCIVKKEIQRQLFYQRSPLEDTTLASMLLKPEPVRALLDFKFPDDDEKAEIDEVPRVYIKTLDDNVISKEYQDDMNEEWPPSDVFTIGSDHSPFFSAPLELFGLLLKVADKYG